MTVASSRAARSRAADAAPDRSGRARVAIVITSERPADQLRARIEGVEGVAGVLVVTGDETDDADLAVVRLGPGECTRGLERVAAWSTRVPVLAVGPVALSSRALRVGATGYLTPRDLETELEPALATVREGRRHLGPSIVDGYLADGLAAAASINRLSARELEILCRAGRGEAPAHTASAIGVAPEAVTQYRLRARAKLGLSTTGHLRVFAATHGLR